MLWRSEGKSSCRNLRSVSVDVLKTSERLLSLTAFRRPAASPLGGRDRQDVRLNLHRIQKQSAPICVKIQIKTIINNHPSRRVPESDDTRCFFSLKCEKFIVINVKKTRLKPPKYASVLEISAGHFSTQK